MTGVVHVSSTLCIPMMSLIQRSVGDSGGPEQGKGHLRDSEGISFLLIYSTKYNINIPNKKYKDMVILEYNYTSLK